MEESTRRHTPPDDLGPMLRAARERTGLHLRTAAARCGISHAHLSRIETKKRVPSMTVARTLADVLDLDGAERERLFAVAIADAGRDWPGRKKRKTAA